MASQNSHAETTQRKKNHQRNPSQTKQEIKMSLEIDKTQKDYTTEINKIKQSIPKEAIPTPQLAKTSHIENYTWKTWRYHIVPGILKHLEKKGEVEKEKRFEGGEATHYWRMKK